jgi:hypothetical protein
MTEGFPQDEFAFPVRVEGDHSAIPAQFRPLYVPDPADGSMKLISPLAQRLDHSGYKTALQKARADAKEVEKREREKHRRTLELLGVESPDDVPLKLEELKRGASAQTDAVRSEVESRLSATFGAQAREARAEAERLKKAFTEQLVESQVTSAIAAARGNVPLLSHHVKASMAVREEGGQFVPRVVDQNGDVRYRPDGLPMAAADLVAELKSKPDFGLAFEGSGNTGSGALGRGGGSGIGAGKLTKSFSKSEWRIAMSLADKKPEEGGYVGGRTQLMRDLTAGKIQIKD